MTSRSARVPLRETTTQLFDERFAMTLRTRVALVLASGVTAGLFQAAAPASAYCIEVAGGCYNPCVIASDTYSTVTGKPGFPCPR